MDIEELSLLVSSQGKAVYGFCHKLTKNKIDADDLYQETFLKAVELRHKIDKDHNPKSFLISIAIGVWKNNCRKYARRNRIAPIQEFDDEVNKGYMLKDESPIEDVVISNELRTKIQSAADSLDNKLKLPLYMYYTAEMSIQEIGQALKIPQGTVKSRLHKARKSLKKVLEEE